MRYVRPRWVFLVYLTGVVIFLAAATGARDNAGIGRSKIARFRTMADELGLAMLFLTLYFESVCFPSIVALGIRGLGRHYKRGSGFIVGGVCGKYHFPYGHDQRY